MAANTAVAYAKVLGYAPVAPSFPDKPEDFPSARRQFDPVSPVLGFFMHQAQHFHADMRVERFSDA